MTDINKTISEIKEGLEGVTPGSWDVDYIQSDGVHYYGVLTDQGFICDTLNSDYRTHDFVRESDGEGDFEDIEMQGMRNMKYLARCNPVAMRAICEHVEELEADNKRAPVQGFSAGIPWEMHLRAYDAYCKLYGKQQALIEGGCRGGFGTGELDRLIPGWRDELSDISRLKAEIEGLSRDYAKARKVEIAQVEAKDAEIMRLKSALGRVKDHRHPDPDTALRNVRGLATDALNADNRDGKDES